MPVIQREEVATKNRSQTFDNQPLAQLIHEETSSLLCNLLILELNRERASTRFHCSSQDVCAEIDLLTIAHRDRLTGQQRFSLPAYRATSARPELIMLFCAKARVRLYSHQNSTWPSTISFETSNLKFVIEFA